MYYQNPIPSLDDKPQSKKVVVAFNFESPVTKEEAAEYITDYFKDAKLTPEAIYLTGNVTMRYAEAGSMSHPRPFEDKK